MQILLRQENGILNRGMATFRQCCGQICAAWVQPRFHLRNSSLVSFPSFLYPIKMYFIRADIKSWERECVLDTLRQLFLTSYNSFLISAFFGEILLFLTAGQNCTECVCRVFLFIQAGFISLLLWIQKPKNKDEQSLWTSPAVAELSHWEFCFGLSEKQAQWFPQWLHSLHF